MDGRSFSRRTLTLGILVLSLVFTVTVQAGDYRFRVGAFGELATLSGGSGPDFTLRQAWGGRLSYDVNPRWTLDLSFGRYVLYNDSTASSSFTFNSDKADATMKFEATRVGICTRTPLAAPTPWMRVIGGAGGGLMIWKMKDPDADTVLKATGSRNETLDFSSTEIFLSALAGLEFEVSDRWALTWAAHADYLTGAGTEFSDDISSARDRWLIGSSITLDFSFGRSDERGGAWRSEQTWPSTPVRPVEPVKGRDSDGDGVPDSEDDCGNTPFGVLVDRNGCGLDTDNDGIADGQDHCPATDVRARGMVDIHGCPVDSDFDGIPDYLDSCPTNPVGAVVDSTGCPLDGDADGVPDGIDDCPETLYGVDVDVHGCLDLSIFSEPMILNIDYPPGSFEIDRSSRERLERLARVLMVVPEMKLEINGYTDNIGTDAANRDLSEKRANRVRDYLVSQGIATDRMRASGRGETNFVASNQTAEGRARNRRIEIVFYK